MLRIIVDNSKIAGVANRRVEAIFGVSRRWLYLLRKNGLLRPHGKTKGGHVRYTLSDLIAIKKIKELQESGISTYRIKKAVEKLEEQFPDKKYPLAEVSLYVVGKEIFVADRKMPYEPLTGQGTFIRNNAIKKWVNETAHLRLEQSLGTVSPSTEGESGVKLKSGGQL